ncbi:Beta-lactamase Toho-1 [Rickettsia tillamookensis]|uniref:beta-lactamase n=1 Tax=Rickettsia tillamookensis TaxID=2761623 RepID=A0A9E6SQI3_9RICK|nr:serine hydrolase [Rickettsia tillamookensis]QQV75253.1 Beta-lactamase Toho-1 [Rickettsia tillamookensis]
MLKSSLLNITKLILLVMLPFFGVTLNAFAETNSSVSDKLKNIESNTEGRLGVFAINTENGHIIKYRADEIFPTQCTSKTIGVAAVLKKSMSDPSLLLQRITYSKKDFELGGWSPITEKHVSEGMTVKELCSAAISFSDNTAMNLLLKTIGGIQGMNDFARSIGDTSFRQDNDWPADKTLDRPQRDFRSSIPNGWIVGNKTGTGGAYGSTNDLAIIWPPKHTPIFGIEEFIAKDKKLKAL